MRTQKKHEPDILHPKKYLANTVRFAQSSMNNYANYKILTKCLTKLFVHTYINFINASSDLADGVY